MRTASGIFLLHLLSVHLLANTFVPKPDESVLLLGSPTVAETKNLTQQFVAADKHPANPVMRRTEKWEGVGPYVWGNRLMHDATTGEFRLWYTAYDFNGNAYRWGLATSRDGLHWNKPDLGLERIGNEPARNCLPLGPHGDKGARSLTRDPRPQTPSERRFLGVRFTYEGEFVSFSPDGIHWKESPSNPVWFVPSDIIHVMWDDARNRFTAYFKVWEVRGTEASPDGKPGKPFLGHSPWFNTKNREGVTEFDGPLIFFRTNAPAEVRKTNFVLIAKNQSADDGGGVSLSGAWTAKRVQCWAESDDGIHWRNERVVLRADDRDPPTSNIQYLFVMRQGGYHLGFLTMHDAGGAFRIQLAWSADGLRWERPQRQPWLDIGAKGAFDCGMVLGPADPILWRKEMWFPYGGFPILHDSTDRNWEAAVGLATMRLDGFSFWEATGQQGELLTQPFRCNGKNLFVNADARRGSLQVEVLQNGKTVKGFEADSCRKVSDDTLEKEPSGWIQWKREKNLRRFEGKTIQLRFVLKDARLFSFRVATDQTKNLPVPRSTQF